LSQHLTAAAEARVFMRRNIDAWLPLLEQGAEAIVISASGCGVTVRDYAALLAADPDYAGKAVRVAAQVRDLAEVIPLAALRALRPLEARPTPIAFHSPCTLQHGQRITGVVEKLLRAAGYGLTPIADAQLCCGSAGTYSLLQPGLSAQLGEAKVRALEQGAPSVIASGNIGCLVQIQSRTTTPVRHWIELLDERLGVSPSLDRARAVPDRG
jgi:glycolate oxidase iron-sulfur subunit